MTRASTENGHFGYEVEYAVPTAPGDKESPIRRCSHPSAREYSTESEVHTGTHHPTLVLWGDDDEAIASYNGLTWIAIRRLAKPTTEAEGATL